MAKTPILKKDLDKLREMWILSPSSDLRNPFNEVYERVITNEDPETLRRGKTTEEVIVDFDFNNKTVGEIRDFFFENFDDDTVIHRVTKDEYDLEVDTEDEYEKQFDKYVAYAIRQETYQEYIDRLYDIFCKHNETITLHKILHKEQIQRKEEIERQMASLQSELDSINKTLK